MNLTNCTIKLSTTCLKKEMGFRGTSVAFQNMFNNSVCALKESAERNKWNSKDVKYSQLSWVGTGDAKRIDRAISLVSGQFICKMSLLGHFIKCSFFYSIKESIFDMFWM